MKPVYINGIGIISAAAKNSSELLAVARGNLKPAACSGKVDFQQQVPAAKVRRASRYAKMTVAAAAAALQDAGLETYDPGRVGTIFATSYGPVESNISFADSVAEGKPSLCSPTTFSYTVPNSCVGQVCIVNDFQGASTMMIGGDPAEYAALLLEGGKADHILCGGIEEYNEELVESLQTASDLLAHSVLAEASVVLLLSAKAGSGAYARITRFSSGALPACPYLHRLTEKEAVPLMKEVLLEAGERKPDLVLGAANGSYLDDYENAAIEGAFGPDITIWSAKKLFGEALGAGYLENIALGAAVLRSGKADLHTVIASGFDAQGNYQTALLEA